jgi:predicted alpha/beta superfamily hydrolase
MKWSVLLWSIVLSTNVISEDIKNNISIGKRYTIHSTLLGEDRTLFVSLPQSYKDRHKYTRYPVLYLLDGEKYFHSFTGAVKQLSSDATPHIPEMIVVGIKSQQRVKDSSPTRSLIGASGKIEKQYEVSGGANKFLSFMKTELIPYIENTYSTSEYRILTGYSFTGLPVIHALFTMPETFNAYIAIDPSWFWDDFILEKRAKHFVENYKLSNRELFVAVHSNPYPADMFPLQKNALSLIDIFNNSELKGLSWGYKIYKDETHHSMPMISLYGALKHIFRGYRASLDTLYKNPLKLEFQYKKLSKRLGAQIFPQEGLMNFFGNQFLNNYNDVEKAITYFELNANNYPSSPNAWESLGDAYTKKGDKVKAKIYYRKSMKLKSNQ